MNALDHALREALSNAYPEMEKFTLTDYRVRILDSSLGSDAVTRVLIETSDAAIVLAHRRVSPRTSSRRPGSRWSTD